MSARPRDLPVITIVTPSFNQGAYIERTIDSILSQNYGALEYIVIDGGSTDNTLAILRKYERHFAYWVSEGDRGQSDAINKGFGRSAGALLTWINSDDWLLPGALHAFAQAFGASPGASLIVGTGQMVNLRGEVTDTYTPASQIDRSVLLQWFSGRWFLQPACMFRREVWLACGPLADDQHLVFDIDFYLRAATAGFEFKSLSKTVAQALRHDNAKTTQQVWRTYIEGALVIEKYGGLGELERQARRLLHAHEASSDQLAWYRRNYTAAIQHPLVRLMRPLAKRFARGTGGYWMDKLPPWMG